MLQKGVTARSSLQSPGTLLQRNETAEPPKAAQVGEQRRQVVPSAPHERTFASRDIEASAEAKTAGLRLASSSFSTKLLRDTRDVLGIDLILERMLFQTSEVVAWVLTIAFMVSIVIWAYNAGGMDLISNVCPIGSAVCLCVLVSLGSFYLGAPWDEFSPTTALITIVFVMEMGTFERFLIKTSLRALGTCVGGLVSVVAAEVSFLLGAHTIVMLGVCFGVFVSDAVMAKRHKEIAYSFAMVSVTFALVFFGYIQKGWPAVWARIISVFIGILIAFLSIVGFALADGEYRSSKSACLLVKKTDTMLKKVIVAIDFAFARNIINSVVDPEHGVARVKEQVFDKEVLDYFEFDDDCEFHELQTMAALSVFASFPVDLDTAALQAESRQISSDMQLVRSATGRFERTFFFELPHVEILADRVHPVYVQASALAHSAPVDVQVWQAEGSKLEEIRKHIQKAQEAWDSIFKLLGDALKDTRHVFENVEKARLDFLSLFQEIAIALQTASAGIVACRKETISKIGLGEKNHFWRFDAFCQSLDIIIAELSSFAVLSMRVFKLNEDHASPEGLCQKTTATLMTLACTAAGDDMEEAELIIQSQSALYQRQRGPIRNEQSLWREYVVSSGGMSRSLAGR